MAGNNLEEHRSKFENYLESLKSNSTVISRIDLNKITEYLKAQLKNETVEISYNLKRRIKSNKLTLASFPSVEDVVCVLKTPSLVS